MTVLDAPVRIRPSSPADFPDSPLSRALRQPLMLGLFLPIQAGGWSASKLPRTTDWSFDYNADLVRQAEGLGFDLVFGLSQWLPKGGYGGVLNGQALDSFISLAAMAAITSRIMLISTVHVLYGPWHPLHFAKFGATLDHISKGRWGVNIVTGHRAVEHEMFGWSRIEHDRRYELATEFVDVVQRLWSETENFSYEGERWRLENAFVTPKPQFGRPVIVNATGSDAGIDFASRYSDIVFMTSPTGSEIESALESLPAHIARIKREARAKGREIRTLINPMVVCRDTEREAQEYYRAIVENADTQAAPQGMGRFDSDAHAWKGRAGRDGPEQRALGGNIQIIGSPARVADYILRLKAVGIDGIQLSFYDFKPDLTQFGARVLPLLKQSGLRL
jgi:FMNH2-dependent dimethyl sulfone monooxygenase